MQAPTRDGSPWVKRAKLKLRLLQRIWPAASTDYPDKINTHPIQAAGGILLRASALSTLLDLNSIIMTIECPEPHY